MAFTIDIITFLFWSDGSVFFFQINMAIAVAIDKAIMIRETVNPIMYLKNLLLEEK